MATKTTSTGTRSSGAKRAPRRRTTGTASKARTAAPKKTRAQSLTTEARTAVRQVRTRAVRAAKKVPTDTRSLSIAAGVIAGIVAAGVALFMNRDRVRGAATTGSERLKKAADDLTSIAHERIDQARDNITKFRARHNGAATPAAPSSPETMTANG